MKRSMSDFSASGPSPGSNARGRDGFLVRHAYGWKYYGALFVAVLGAFLIYCSSVANGPDLTLQFDREVHSKQSPAEVNQLLTSPLQWKNWFYNMTDAKILDSENHPLPDAQQQIHPGAVLKLFMDPHRGLHNQFELVARVKAYVPGKLLELQVLDESTGKLFRLFDQLDWKIEVLPEGSGSLIRGSEVAHTSHWRSRLFGAIARRVLLNQIFYPNLMKLAQPDFHPSSPISFGPNM